MCIDELFSAGKDHECKKKNQSIKQGKRLLNALTSKRLYRNATKQIQSVRLI